MCSYFAMKTKRGNERIKRDVLFSIQGGRLLPTIPTAKYPNRAMMKRIQQRTSVQPLCTAEAAEGHMMLQETGVSSLLKMSLTCCGWAL